MKPDFFDLNDESIFVDTAIHPKDLEKYKGLYIVLGVIGLIALSFFLIPIITFALNGGWPIACFIGIPLIIGLTSTLHRFLQAKIISDYGVFITNRKGKVKCGFLWSELKKVTYDISSHENGRSFRIIIKPEKGRKIEFYDTCPIVSAYFLTFFIRKTPNGEQRVREIISSLDEKHHFFFSPQEEQFRETLKELVGKEITIQQIKEQLRLTAKREFDEMEFKIYK